MERCGNQFPEPSRLPVLSSLDDMVALVREGGRFSVRWSRGPHADLVTAESCGRPDRRELARTFRRLLAGGGLVAGRPVRLWVARRLHDYSHGCGDKGPGIRPWILRGRLVGRGPANEPLVAAVHPIAWSAAVVITEAETEVTRGTSSSHMIVRATPSALVGGGDAQSASSAAWNASAVGATTTASP
ncbi:DUF6098 family protein [Actinacidiphila glaucinigra]|uniref:DUF6098 family protein n=1 Tax=Actinacidiphila glaucinigra TaxID=235986 RepID=UPI003862F6F9